MRACILNSQTKIVENVLIIQETPENFIPYKEGIELAPQSDGEIGWTWNGTEWDIPTRPLEEVERERRDKYLHLYVDIINAVRWNSLTEQQKDDLSAYRQTLLDVPQQSGFPAIINWPTPPEF
jgi:hypothetical protein